MVASGSRCDSAAERSSSNATCRWPPFSYAPFSHALRAVLQMMAFGPTRDLAMEHNNTSAGSHWPHLVRAPTATVQA
eukprot:11981774-Alexandrium_andersonii.AAC.1